MVHVRTGAARPRFVRRAGRDLVCAGCFVSWGRGRNAPTGERGAAIYAGAVEGEAHGTSICRRSRRSLGAAALGVAAAAHDLAFRVAFARVLLAEFAAEALTFRHRTLAGGVRTSLGLLFHVTSRSSLHEPQGQVQTAFPSAEIRQCFPFGAVRRRTLPARRMPARDSPRIVQDARCDPSATRAPQTPVRGRSRASDSLQRAAARRSPCGRTPCIRR